MGRWTLHSRRLDETPHQSSPRYGTSTMVVTNSRKIVFSAVKLRRNGFTIHFEGHHSQRNRSYMFHKNHPEKIIWLIYCGDSVYAKIFIPGLYRTKKNPEEKREVGPIDEMPSAAEVSTGSRGGFASQPRIEESAGVQPEADR